MSARSQTANSYLLIFHLFKIWTGYATNFEHHLFGENDLGGVPSGIRVLVVPRLAAHAAPLGFSCCPQV
jgi:hypothetical protein